MKTYELSVFVRLISDAVVVHVYQIKVAQPIEWVRKNADEMAQKFLTGAVKNYCALMVTERQ